MQPSARKTHTAGQNTGDRVEGTAPFWTRNDTDGLPALVSYIDKDERYTRVNSTYAEWFRLEPEQMVGQKVQEVLTRVAGESYWLHVAAYLKRALAGEPVVFEAATDYGDGWRNVVVHYTPDCDDTGQVRGVIALIIDVSQGRRAEEERDRFFMLSLDLFCIVDAQGCFHRVNPAFTQTLGWAESELLDKRFADFVHPDDRARTINAFEQIRNRTVLRRFKNRYRKRDGSYVWLSWASNAVAGGQIYAAAQDITEDQQARETLARQAALLDQALEPIFTWQLGGPILYWNNASEQLYGYTAAEAIGRRTHHLLRTELGMPAEEFDANLFEKGEWRGELVHYTRDNRKLLVDSLHKVVNEGGRLVVFESNRDITERKRVESDLRELAENLELRVAERTRALAEANRELEAFGYSVSHDLRAPLRTLQGFSRALIEDYANILPAEARHYLERIALAAERMDLLIQDLLAYSRLTRAELRLQPVSLSQVLREALEQLQTAISESHAGIDIREPLGTVQGHFSTLVQLFANLISNAIKFVKADETPRVCIYSESRNEMIRVWVEDNGIGIEPEYQERIFEVFQRLHGLEAYPGTGIGLAIVRRGAQQLGGSAGVESQPDHGSRFWVELRREDS